MSICGAPAAFRASRGAAGRSAGRPARQPAVEIRLMTPVCEPRSLAEGAADPTLQIAVVAAGTVAVDVTAGRDLAVPRPCGREDQKYAAMRAATVALATSGTVSTELALAGAPTVIAYRFQPLSYAIMKPFFTGKYATLFNHAAGEEIARELIQNDAAGWRRVGRLLRSGGAAGAGGAATAADLIVMRDATRRRSLRTGAAGDREQGGPKPASARPPASARSMLSGKIVVAHERRA
jgi:lipid-A-disaccharide synthase